MDFEIDEDALQDLYEETGENLAAIFNSTARDTADQDVDTAAATLVGRLADAGVTFDPDEATNAIETLRRGETYNITLT